MIYDDYKELSVADLLMSAEIGIAFECHSWNLNQPLLVGNIIVLDI